MRLCSTDGPTGERETEKGTANDGKVDRHLNERRVESEGWMKISTVPAGLLCRDHEAEQGFEAGCAGGGQKLAVTILRQQQAWSRQARPTRLELGQGARSRRFSRPPLAWKQG